MGRYPNIVFIVLHLVMSYIEQLISTVYTFLAILACQ